jgi:hypothetical protein
MIASIFFITLCLSPLLRPDKFGVPFSDVQVKATRPSPEGTVASNKARCVPTGDVAPEILPAQGNPPLKAANLTNGMVVYRI